MFYYFDSGLGRLAYTQVWEVTLGQPKVMLIASNASCGRFKRKLPVAPFATATLVKGRRSVGVKLGV